MTKNNLTAIAVIGAGAYMLLSKPKPTDDQFILEGGQGVTGTGGQAPVQDIFNITIESPFDAGFDTIENVDKIDVDIKPKTRSIQTEPLVLGMTKTQFYSGYTRSRPKPISALKGTAYDTSDPFGLFVTSGQQPIGQSIDTKRYSQTSNSSPTIVNLKQIADKGGVAGMKAREDLKKKGVVY